MQPVFDETTLVGCEAATGAQTHLKHSEWTNDIEPSLRYDYADGREMHASKP